jgi:hypothetical protein
VGVFLPDVSVLVVTPDIGRSAPPSVPSWSSLHFKREGARKRAMYAGSSIRRAGEEEGGQGGHTALKQSIQDGKQQQQQQQQQ